ncbi:MAG: tRNA (adenosine(37)-N6)-dimethylallyltransferase MiaA [Clostridia bacterium]|nr:tRNA (adenosine(37)-N6)-dimethylallyltransferase MiaA [Clostridia bacterium]
MEINSKPKVICIVGPTASGKTALSIELAKRLNTEIISVDSMQIYKKLEVGTAKVTKEEMQNVKHHLIDFVDLEEDFSVADFKKLATQKIEEIVESGKVPILVGGTGLYMSAIIQNMDFKEEKIDEKYRAKLYNLAKEKGNNYVHDMLKKVDRMSAELIHPNNLKRVIRALELCRGNETKSMHMENEKERLKKEESKYDFKLFCTYYPKDILDARINLRVDKMMQNGLEEEAKIVYGLKKGTVRQAVGYKEFFDYFEGRKSKEEVIEEIKLRSRQYAKRQNTWFKKMENVNFIDMREDLEVHVNKIMELIYEERKGSI